MTFYLRPQAEADLEDIALYIAEDNVQAARRWIEDMHALANSLARCLPWKWPNPLFDPD